MGPIYYSNLTELLKMHLNLAKKICRRVKNIWVCVCVIGGVVACQCLGESPER